LAVDGNQVDGEQASIPHVPAIARYVEELADAMESVDVAKAASMLRRVCMGSRQKNGRSALSANRPISGRRGCRACAIRSHRPFVPTSELQSPERVHGC
jgi:hypothetical protein